MPLRASTFKSTSPLVSIIMGSDSDWETMGACAEVLERLQVPFEARVVSAHRTPDLLFEFAASAQERGIEVIVAGAGGAAHLPGMAASKTTVPVLGVPVEATSLKGLDALLSIVQMPAGVPVGTLAIGKAGAKNAAYLAAQILANKYPKIRESLVKLRRAEASRISAIGDPRSIIGRSSATGYKRRKPINRPIKLSRSNSKGSGRKS